MINNATFVYICCTVVVLVPKLGEKVNYILMSLYIHIHIVIHLGLIILLRELADELPNLDANENWLESYTLSIYN